MIYIISNLIIISLFVYFIFYLINKTNNVVENMSITNPNFMSYLKKNNFKIDKKNKIISKCNKNNCNFLKYYSTKFNRTESFPLTEDKSLCNKLFKKYNIPVPNSIVIKKKYISYYLNKFNPKFPCVLKPVSGTQGTDVNAYITKKSSFDKILKKLLNKYKDVLYEDYIVGNVYRIFTFNNKVIDIILRIPPTIEGNGVNTIKELININKKSINKKNKLKKKEFYSEKNKNKNRKYFRCSVPVTFIAWDLIEKQGYKKNDILENKKKIEITGTINCHNGAVPVRIPLKKVPKVNLDMFAKAHKLAGLECSGIDYISPDITVPYFENNGSIIEINYSPGNRIHYCANENNTNYLYKNMLETIL